MPVETRYILGAFFLLVGIVAVYQRLRPPVPVAESADQSAESLYWRVAAIITLIWATLLASGTAAFPGEAVELAMGVARYVAGFVRGWLMEAGIITEAKAGEAIGPLQPTAPGWTYAVAGAPLVFPAALYAAAALDRAHKRGAAALTMGLAALVFILLVPFHLAMLRVVTGETYREEIGRWLDSVTPVRPQDSMWGREGPVVFQGFATQYREVEQDILYRRRTSITESGEAVHSEAMNPFRMGPFTVKVEEGKYTVTGIQTIDRVIVVNERLKVAGYLSGAAVISKKETPLVIMPSSFGEWRRALRDTWAAASLGGKIAVYAAVAYDAYMAALLIMAAVIYVARLRRIVVKTAGEETACRETPKT